MKTIAYTEVLNRASEAAGRTRDTLPLSEAAILKSVFAAELPKVWFGEAWNDLTPPLLPVTVDPVAKSFPNPYTGGAAPVTFGEVLMVLTQDPASGTPWLRLDFYRSQDTYVVSPPTVHAPNAFPVPIPSTVYVWYLIDMPDLLGMTDTQLQGLTLPLFLGNYLALRGAGHLLAADGAQALAGVQFGLAESALAFERSRIRRPVWSTPG